MLACTAARSASSGARTASSDRSLRPVVSHTGGCDIQMTAPRRSLPAIFMPVMSVASSLACCRLAASRSASRSTAPSRRAKFSTAPCMAALEKSASCSCAPVRSAPCSEALRKLTPCACTPPVRSALSRCALERLAPVSSELDRSAPSSCASSSLAPRRSTPHSRARAQLGAGQVDVARRDALGRHAIVAQHDDVGLGAVQRRVLQVGADEAGAVEAGAGQVGAGRSVRSSLA